MTSLAQLAQKTVKPFIPSGLFRKPPQPARTESPVRETDPRESLETAFVSNVVAATASPAPTTRITASGVSFTEDTGNGSFELNLPTGFKVKKDGEGKISGQDVQGNSILHPRETFKEWSGSNVLSFQSPSGEHHEVNLKSLDLKVASADKRFDQALKADGTQTVTVLVPHLMDGQRMLALNETTFTPQGKVDAFYGEQGDLSFPDRHSVLHPNKDGTRSLKKLFFPLPRGAGSESQAEPLQDNGWLIR